MFCSQYGSRCAGRPSAKTAFREAQYAKKAHDTQRAAQLLRTALPALREELAPNAPDRLGAEKLDAELHAAAAKRTIVENR